MIDWIKSFIAACVAFVALLIAAAIIIYVMFVMYNIHPLILPTIAIVGILALLTFIAHGTGNED